MKIKLFLRNLLALIPAFLLLSCDEETVVTDVLVISKDSVIVPAQGGSETIKFTSIADWSVSSKESWIIVSPSSGNAGDTSLTITVKANTETKARKGEILISVPSQQFSHTIKVEQAAGEAPQSRISWSIGDEAELDAAYHRYHIEEFSSSDPWTFTVDQDWVSVDPSSGEAGFYERQIYISVQANNTAQARVATVTVKAGDVTKTHVIKQAAGEVQEQPDPDTPGSSWHWYATPEGEIAEFTFKSDYLNMRCKSRLVWREVGSIIEFRTVTEPVTGGDGVERYGFFNMSKSKDECAELVFFEHLDQNLSVELPYQEIYYDNDNSKWVFVSDYASYQVRQGRYSSWADVPIGERLPSEVVADGTINLDAYVYECPGVYTYIIDESWDLRAWIRDDFVSAWPDLQYQGKRKVTIYAGEDVNTIYFQWYKGDVGEMAESIDEIKALADDVREQGFNAVNLPDELSPRSGRKEVSMYVSFREPGLYTIVVATNTGSYGICCVEYAADGDRDVKISVWQGDGLETSNSFTCFLWGSGIDRAYAMLFTEEEFLANMDECLNKTMNEGKQIVYSSSDVSETSGPIFKGENLKAGTRYVAVVWACNEIKMDWAYATIETKGD